MQNDDLHLLSRAARRFSTDPAFFGHMLQAAQLEPEAIARALDTAIEIAIRLAFCLTPRQDSPAVLQADIQEIARHFGLEPMRLLVLFREAEVLAALHAGQVRGAIGAPSIGLAARDREESPPAGESETTLEGGSA